MDTKKTEPLLTLPQTLVLNQDMLSKLQLIKTIFLYLCRGAHKADNSLK